MSSRSMTAASPPNLAIEIARGRVCVAGLTRSGGGAAVSAYATEPLPDDAVVPGLMDSNIADVAVVADALRQALARAGLTWHSMPQHRRPGTAALLAAGCPGGHGCPCC